MIWPLCLLRVGGTRERLGFYLPREWKFFAQPVLVESVALKLKRKNAHLALLPRKPGLPFYREHEDELVQDQHWELPFKEWNLQMTSPQGGGGERRGREISELEQNTLIIGVPSLSSGFWAAPPNLCPLFSLCDTWEEFWSLPK